MAVRLSIEDDRIENFSVEAKETLKQQIDKYAGDLIKEANLIEEGIREDGASREITSNTILQAVRKSRTFKKKNPVWLWICKIVSAITLAIMGFLFDKDGYQSHPWQLLIFILIVVIATGTTVVSFMEKE